MDRDLLEDALAGAAGLTSAKDRPVFGRGQDRATASRASVTRLRRQVVRLLEDLPAGVTVLELLDALDTGEGDFPED